MIPSGADLPESPVYELLARSIGRDLTPAEDEEARRAAEALFAQPGALELLREVVIEEGMLRALLERIHPQHGPGGALALGGSRRADRAPFAHRWQHQHRASSWRRAVLKVAAIVLVVGGIATGIELRGGLKRMHRGAPPAPHSVITRPGQRASVNLPDGSRAILAPNTELRYTISPNTGPRELQLDGEAYFDVRHDAARPFRVHTRRAVIQDVGTTFVVREYSTDTRARVAVRSGAVTLHAGAARDASGVAVRQGEAVAFDSSGAVVRLAGDPASDWAWTTGRLVFDEAPLPAVLAELHRWYDVDFRLDDSTLATQYFTGAFNAAPLPQVLDILGPVVHARFEQQGRGVVVTRRPGSQ